MPIQNRPQTSLTPNLSDLPPVGDGRGSRRLGYRKRRPLLKGFLSVFAVLVSAWTLGLIAFVFAVPRAPVTIAEPADAVVVLTGGGARLSAGYDLLVQGKADRLLISGVYADTSRETLKRKLGADPDRFDCCVDLDRAALDTRGNAVETARWTKIHGFDTLIVVTANYHMPRSLLEFRRAMPEVTLIPYPVFPGGFDAEAWWMGVNSLRLATGEYVKYLASLTALPV